MSTTLPTSTYPLSDKTRFLDDHVVERDMLDDGSMRVRVLSDDTYRRLRLVFSPLYSDDAETLAAYLRTNKSTEFDITYKSVTYTGYIWSDISVDPFDGDCSIVALEFRGKVS